MADPKPYSRSEAIERIYRLLRGDTLPEEPEALDGEQFSEDEALSRIAHLLQGTLAGETGQVPTTTSIPGEDPHYGSIAVEDGSTAQASIGTATVLFTGFDADGESNGLTVNAANNRIVIGRDGTYLIQFQCSFSGDNNIEVGMHLRVGGVRQHPGLHRKLSAAGDVGSASFFDIRALSAADILTIGVRTDQGGGASITPIDSQFVISELL